MILPSPKKSMKCASRLWRAARLCRAAGVASLLAITLALAPLAPLLPISLPAPLAPLAAPTAHAAATFGATLTMPGNTLGLVGHWTFDGKNLINNVADTSGQGNTGYMVAAATSSQTVPGPLGQALKFDGSTQYIDTPAQSIPGPITVSAWVFWAAGSNGGIIEKTPLNHQWELFFNSGQLQWRGGGSTNTPACAGPSKNVWHFIVGQQTGTTATIYVDGQPCTTATADALGNGTTPGTNDIDIGRLDNGSYYLNGTLDDARVYNRALSAGEVQQLYNQGTGLHVTNSPGSVAKHVYLINTAASAWTVPTDWNSTGATIECVGPGGSGHLAGVSGAGGGGGQGGGYGKVTNPSNISAGNSLTIQVGAGGSTNATFLKDNTGTIICQGDYGLSPSGTTGGNRSQTNTGATATHTGGNGGSATADDAGGGGGGAGGPNGNGQSGGSSSSVSTDIGGGGGGAASGGSAGARASATNSNGGAGGNNSNAAGGGTAGTGTTPGGNGTPSSPYGGAGGGGGGGSSTPQNGGSGAIGEEWDTTHGSGGGGGAGGASFSSVSAATAGAAGLYGGGGAGGSGTSSKQGFGAGGAQGIIVITYRSRIVVNTTLTPPNLASGLVGHWTFDGKNLINNVADTSGQGNNGSLVGFTATSSAVVPGPLGQALKFNGTSQYVQTVDFSWTLAQPYSLSLWVKPTLGSSMGILGKSLYEYAIEVGSGGLLQFFYWDSGGATVLGLTCSVTMKSTMWQLVTVSYDGANHGTIYLNGVSCGTGTASGTPGNRTTTLDIGESWYSGVGNTFFKGTIDDVRIYNRALSAGEVQQLYNLGH